MTARSFTGRAAGFHGVDSFQYRLIDEHGGVTVARAQVRVAPINPLLAHGPLLFEAVSSHVLRETSPVNHGFHAATSRDGRRGRRPG